MTVKKLLCFGLAVCLAVSLWGCGGKAEEPGPEEIFEELLAADYQVYHLFYNGGLSADSGQTKMLENNLYWLVTDPDYNTMDALQRRLEGIYLRSETVKGILGTTDAEGHPLLRSQDGRLWRSSAPEASVFGYEVEEGGIALVSLAETAAAFSVQETALDGSLYEARLSMTKTAAGWRLDGPRWEAERTLVREGSDKKSLVSSGAARRAAEKFLGSILDGGVPDLPWSTAAWQNVKIRSAVLTQALEELDSQGVYLVRVDVEDGGGVFPEGMQDYRLVMGFDVMRFGDESTVYPVYFRPASEQYYNKTSYVEQNYGGLGSAEYVKSFIDYFGMVTFRSPWDLPPETVVEFSLFFARSEEGDQRFTQQEMDDAILRTFGITGFDSRSTRFYVPEQDRYLLWGRDSSVRDYLIKMPEIKGGNAQVEVTFYEDVLCTTPLRTVLYTLEKEEDSWRLLSATLAE